MDTKQKKELEIMCAKVRIDIFEMLMNFGQGHLGGSMSLVETMAVLYGKQLRVDAADPQREDRDKVVLSKGHAGPVWYATLAEKGFFAKEALLTLNQEKTMLPSHPDRLLTPGVDMTTGSLGQGVSSAAGIATGQKLKGSDAKTFVIVGDGELNEGQCWEAFQYIAARRLNNCIVIIDNNKKQLDGILEDVLDPFDIPDKMRAFGFETKVVKGDDLEAIDEALTQAKNAEDHAVCIVLDSIKGRSTGYFETMAGNHSVKFSDEVKSEAEKAIKRYKAFLKKEGA